jgi:hypothetical protein
MTTTTVPQRDPALVTGLEVLAELPLANPAIAEQKLADFLDGLLASPPVAATLMALLEQARFPLSFVAEELAKRYQRQPLPLSVEEETALQRVIAGWERMEKGYALCARLQQPEPDNPQFTTLIATIVHRCLYYSGMTIFEHFRARREVPAGLWQDLHGYYATAEEWQVTNTPVNDALENDLQATHCSAAYLAVQLIEIAGPYGCSIRDLNLIRRWASMWAPLVSVHPLDNDYEIPPYVIELLKDLPLHPSGAAENIGDDARRLDMSRLGLQISHMVSQLHQRLTPSQLGLGEDTSGHVIRLLERLSRPWTQSASPRRFRRFASQDSARVAMSLPAIHFFVGGREFIQPDSTEAYSRKEFEALYTFRDRVGPGEPLAINPKANYETEDWAVINHSANGFRLSRGCAGTRIAHGQLVAVCPHDGERFLLGHAIWLMEEEEKSVVVGISVLPGIPTAGAARVQAGEGGQHERFVRGFMLTAVPAINEEGSLVLPSGTYQPSRILEIQGEGGSMLVRMKTMRIRGTDFDRVTYEPV